jgi:hypothetical protein
MKVHLWRDSTLLEDPQIDLIDDDVKGKLGAEPLELQPRAALHQNGSFIIGY